MNTHKVLLDLSSVLSGNTPYSGIPQETRVLFKMFSENQRIQPIGLICPDGQGHITIPNKPTWDLPILESLENAEYITGLQQSPGPKNKLKKAYRLARVLLKLRHKNYFLYPFNNHHLDCIWRKAFHEFIDASDKDLLLSQTFVKCYLDRYFLNMSTHFNFKVPTLHTDGMDFAIFQHGIPICPTVSKETIPIVRFHDTIPLLMPDTTVDTHYTKLHVKSILSSSKRAIFVCNSEPVRDELLKCLPQFENKTYVVTPSVVSDKPAAKEYAALPNIISARRSAQDRIPTIAECSNYIISVSTIEPRKNFISLIRAWERVRYQKDDQLKLIIVGSNGWKNEATDTAMQTHIAAGNIIHLQKVPLYELKILYACARAKVFPTFYEGFGITPIEAMLEGCPVIVSDTITTRWVLKDAPLYCNPYDVSSISDAIIRLLYSDESIKLREEKIEKGHQLVEKYSTTAISQEWLALFDRLKSS